MKTKHEILTALAHSGEEKILLASLLDKEQTCDARGYLTSTRFLSMSERALCTEAVHQAGATGHAVFWGGYEDAERGETFVKSRIPIFAISEVRKKTAFFAELCNSAVSSMIISLSEGQS